MNKMSSSATSSGAGTASASASTSASRTSSSFNSKIPGEGDASSARMADMGDDELLCVNFNQDSTCCVLGTTSGYRILNFNPFGHNSYQAGGGIGIVEMLFCTSLIAIVGGGASPASSPRKLKLWDSKRSLTICELDFGAAILRVRLNSKRIVVALARELHIFDLSTMKNLQTMELDEPSPGLCALSPDDSSCILAVPTCKNGAGEVVLYDALNLNALTIIQAHKTAVANLAFSQDGRMLATASKKGTVIRVFSCTGERVCSFRRGAYQAEIHSLSFDKSGAHLAVSSATGTIHVFKLPEGKSGARSSSFISRTFSFVENERDFASVKVAASADKNGCCNWKCALVETAETATPNLIAVNKDGEFRRWTIDDETGECKLLRSNNVLRLDMHQLGKTPGK